MQELYFKNHHKYGNGEKTKDYCYYRIRQDGTITTLSKSRHRVVQSKSLILPPGFELSSKEEFDKVLKEIIG